MFESILDSVTGSLSIVSSLECMGMAIVLGLVIAFVHMHTGKYTKNFVISLAVLPALVQVVIMMVNGNLGTSVAVLGAFGLIRFRSLPGNAKEITSIFFAMAIGLSLGMGHILFATYITIIVSLLLFILSKTKFGSTNDKGRNLKIIIPEDLNYTEVFDDIMKEYTTECMLQRVKTINMGSMYEMTYSLVLKDESKEKEFLDKLRIKNGNLNITLSRYIEGVNEL